VSWHSKRDGPLETSTFAAGIATDQDPVQRAFMQPTDWRRHLCSKSASSARLQCSCVAVRPDARRYTYNRQRVEDVDPNGHITYVTEGLLRALDRAVLQGPFLYVVPGAWHCFRRADARSLIPGTQAFRSRNGENLAAFLRKAAKPQRFFLQDASSAMLAPCRHSQVISRFFFPARPEGLLAARFGPGRQS
jgi:hypothetical protein